MVNRPSFKEVNFMLTEYKPINKYKLIKKNEVAYISSTNEQHIKLICT